MPNYRLALDIGTSSVGLVALALDKNLEPTTLLHHSCCIFPEPVLPAKKGGVGEPKSAARRRARQARRLIERRARRLRRIAHLSRLLGMESASIPSDSGQQIHALRARAATEPIALPDFVNVLLKLVKRRGYSGGFRVKDEDQERGPVQSGINALHEAMRAARCSTLGEFLATRFEAGESLKLKHSGLYADRALIEREFEILWNTQAEHHPVLNGSFDGKPLKEIFREAVFHQRPLKSPRPMVGSCPLEPTLSRAPAAQPAAQEFRIEKQIADLRWGSGRASEPISLEQKAVIRDLLREKREVSFDAIYRALEKAGCPKPIARWLNSSRGGREELRGNATLAAFRKMGLADEWAALEPIHQIQVINFLADLGSLEQLDAPDWHLRFTKQGRMGLEPRRFPEEMVAFINAIAETGKLARLSAMGFDTGRNAYSVKAMRKLIPLMQEGWDEHYAIREAYPRRPQPETRNTTLDPHPPTGNMVVDVALREVRRGVNMAIAKLGAPPAQVIVEMSRDMALGIEGRKKVSLENASNQRQRIRARQEIKAVGLNPSDSNIRRFLLWTEQEQSWCPYCTARINLNDALDGNVTNIDHILPRSLTQVGRRRDQLVLAHRKCNDEKRDRTPWEVWGQDPVRWTVIEEHAAKLEKKRLFGKARLLRIKDYERETLTEADINDFADRQLHQTSWIGKLALGWMSTICKDVAVSRGVMTAYLRRIWKLDTVIPEARLAAGLVVLDTDGVPISASEFELYRRYWENHERAPGVVRTDRRSDKRMDHRHHLIDALVIGLTSRSLYQRMARNYKLQSERAAAGERVSLSLAVAPPIKDIRSVALSMVSAPGLRHKPDHYLQGRLFEETAYTAYVKDNKPILALRAALADLADANTSVEAARKKIGEIAADYTRDLVSRAFESRVARGMTATEALSIPILYPGYDTPIKRVLVRKDGTARVIEHTNRNGVKLHKRLKSDGYAYLEMEHQEDKVTVRLVTPDSAVGQTAKRKHQVTRFFKGDTVLEPESGLRYVVKQIKAEGGGSLILVRETEALAADKLKGLGGRKMVSGKSLRSLRPVNV